MLTKTIIKALFRLAGLEVRRRTNWFGIDAFADQHRLLHGRTVRTIFDVGANVGQTAEKYRALFPAADLHCFEPFPESFARLAEAEGSFPGSRLHPLAVTDTSGTGSFFSNRYDYTNSLLPFAAGAERYIHPTMVATRERIKVATIRLDDFCSKNDIRGIDILKMDIQGGELHALRGAAGLLEKRAIGLIYSEVLFAPLYEGQANFAEILQYLTRFGYQLFGLYNLHHSMRAGLAWCDALFISPI